MSRSDPSAPPGGPAAHDAHPPLVRTRLIDRLEAARTGRATVIAAPRGAGKTTLVDTWLHARDPEPVHRVGAGGSLEPWPDAPLVVVDPIDGEDAAASARALIDRVDAAAGQHLLLVTDLDLADALADLRVRHEIELLGPRDLAFDDADLRNLVRTTTGLEVDPTVAAAVIADLGGWAAGAHRVAIGWDPATTTDDRAEVLAERYLELAERRWADLASILNPEVIAELAGLTHLPGLHADLWNDLLDRSDGAAVLDRLRGHGQVVEHPWHEGLFQLHPLCRLTVPPPAPSLGVAAASWYAERRLIIPSAYCYVAIGDWDAMAETVLANVFDLIEPDRVPELADLVRDLPPDVLHRRFQWALGLIHVLLVTGDVDGARAMQAVVGVGTTPRHQIPALVQRSNFAGFLEDPTPCLEDAEEALRLCDEVGEDYEYDDIFTTSYTRHWRVQARASVLLAGAYLGAWDRVAPHAGPVDAASAIEIPPHGGLIPIFARRSIYFALGGWLRESEAEAHRALELHGDFPTQTQTVDAHLAIGEVHRLRREDDLAAARLALAHEAALEVGRPASVANAQAALALFHLDAGRPDEARRVLEPRPGATPYEGPPTVLGRRVAARALSEHRLGHPDSARGLLASAPVTSEVAAAGVQIALELGQPADAQEWLARWPAEATPLSTATCAAARAFTSELVGDRATAHEHLALALRSAGPHGLVQPVARFGVLGLAPLRAATVDPDPRIADPARAALVAIQPTPTLASLSDRERLVLHHLATRATAQEVARRLVVSPNTLRTQTRYYVNESIPASYSCNDAEEGAAISCTGPVGNGAAIDTGTAGAKSFTVTAQDTPGLTGSTTTNYEVFPYPTAAITAPALGTVYTPNQGPVPTFTGGCAGGIPNLGCGATVTKPSGAVVAIASGAQIPFDEFGTHTISVAAVDGRGTIVTAQRTYRINRPPTAAVATPIAGKRYFVGQSVAASYSCADLDGTVVSCTGPVAVGQQIDTTTVGVKTFTVNAVDNDGGYGSKTVTYTVHPVVGPCRGSGLRALGLNFGVANEPVNPCTAASKTDIATASASVTWLGLTVPGVNAGVLSGTTSKGIGSHTANAIVSGLKVTVAPGLVLTVDALAASTTSQLVDCDIPATTTWSSLIGRVTINGQPVVVNGSGTVLDLGVAKLTIGDVRTVAGTSTVRPIFLDLPGTAADVVVAEVIAGAECGPLP